MDPIPFALAGVFSALYALGGRRRKLRSVSAGRRRSTERVLRSTCFYAGVVATVIALEPPVDRLSERFFFIHMLQHLLLMMVAAPLIVLGAPVDSQRGFRRPFSRDVWSVLNDAPCPVMIATGAPPSVERAVA